MDLRDICWESMEWIYLVEGRNRRRALVNTVMDFRVLATRS
jgi:hypothetical protein